MPIKNETKGSKKDIIKKKKKPNNKTNSYKKKAKDNPSLGIKECDFIMTL